MQLDMDSDVKVFIGLVAKDIKVDLIELDEFPDAVGGDLGEEVGHPLLGGHGDRAVHLGQSFLVAVSFESGVQAILLKIKSACFQSCRCITVAKVMLAPVRQA